MPARVSEVRILPLPFMKTAGKKILGVVLILVGVIAFFTPLTPGSWLVFIGLEFLGIRLAFWQRIKTYFKK